jgi:hypothetical protein
VSTSVCPDLFRKDSRVSGIRTITEWKVVPFLLRLFTTDILPHKQAHFVSLTAETDLGANLVGPIEAKPFNASTGHVNGPFGAPNQQINFLIDDLRRVNRQKTPWVVVFIHRPWYCSSGCEPGEAWQQAFEKILYDNNVDLVMHGHVHNYEVFAPIYNGTFLSSIHLALSFRPLGY